MKIKGVPRENLAYQKTPLWVDVMSRLKHDVKALLELTYHDEPPDVLIRATNKDAYYLVGDASKAGFG